MRNPTPFFSAFKHLLFGRPARSLASILQASSGASSSLGELRALFGSMITEALLAPEQEGIGSRKRLFSTSVTFWAFLSQVLCPDAACRHAVRKVQAWAGFEGILEFSASTCAYCKARSRLALRTLAHIHDHLVCRLESNTPQAARWLSRRVKVVDGTNLSMPDTPENQGPWPQPTSQKPGCGFPMMKLAGLFSLASGALLAVAKGNLHVHESQLFKQLWDELDPEDVLLSDRGFCSFVTICSLLARGIDTVMRLHQARKSDGRNGKYLGCGDRLVTWRKPAQRTAAWSPQEFAALPAQMTLRQITLYVTTPGFRSSKIVLVTTLLDPKRYPADAIRDLYAQRWSVELHFREIKTSLRLDVLRCKTPPMIERELWLHLIAYNLVRCLMQQAANTYHVDLSRLSFKGTLDALTHFADALHARAGRPRKQARLFEEMLRLIADDLVPLRPLRSEPRAKKRRAKNYHLLTKPRHKMRVPPHRNRPKSVLS